MTENSEQVAVIVQMGPGSQCKVRFPDGTVVVASIPRHAARVMFRIVPGDRVRVSGPLGGKVRVNGFARDSVKEDE
jgi:translation initiation factor IF-1